MVIAVAVVVAALQSAGVGSAAVNCARGPVSDEFNGPAGAPPDPGLWNQQIGAGGSDGQVEAYTADPRNSSLDGDGSLAIVARQEPVPVPGYGTFPYSSAYLTTHGKLDLCFGTVSARIKLPTGQGLRPAFWLLGSDFDTVGWPQCGEIDIQELPNNGSSLHGPGGYLLNADAPFDTGTSWHEYSVDWEPGRITTSVDGQPMANWTPESLPAGAPWTFDEKHPMYVILNIAVGGSGGGPDGSTASRATMLVDWMRYVPSAAA